MVSLQAAIQSLAEDGAGYWLEAPEGWTQGRTLFGGMTAALCAEAARRRWPQLPPLRSAQFAFLGPAAGRLALRPELLRQGRSSAVVSVDAAAEGGPAARAMLTYGVARPSAIAHDLAPPPSLPAPSDCPPLFAEGSAPAGFFQKFEMRLAGGGRILSPGATPEFTVWVRLVEPADMDPVVALLVVGDSLPPAAMISFAERAPISTMTWTLDIAHPVEPGEWRLLRSASEQAADGYSLQAMELWSEDRRRLAVGRQTIAIFA